MEDLAEVKIEEGKERKLVEWNLEEAKAHHASGIDVMTQLVSKCWRTTASGVRRGQNPRTDCSCHPCRCSSADAPNQQTLLPDPAALL